MASARLAGAYGADRVDGELVSFGAGHPSRPAKYVEVTPGTTVVVTNTDQVRQATVVVGPATILLDRAQGGTDSRRTILIPDDVTEIHVSEGVRVEFQP